MSSVTSVSNPSAAKSAKFIANATRQSQASLVRMGSPYDPRIPPQPGISSSSSPKLLNVSGSTKYISGRTSLTRLLQNENVVENQHSDVKNIISSNLPIAKVKTSQSKKNFPKVKLLNLNQN